MNHLSVICGSRKP